MPSFSLYHGGVICLPSPHDFLLHVLNTQLNFGANLSFKFQMGFIPTLAPQVYIFLPRGHNQEFLTMSPLSCPHKDFP